VRIQLPRSGDSFLLREFEVSDASRLCEIEYDPNVKQYLGVPKKPKRQWVRDFRQAFYDQVDFAIIALPEGKLCGRASISPYGRHLGGCARFRELQIVLGAHLRLKGRGEAVARQLVEASYFELGAEVMVAVVHPDNAASIGLVGKLGFTLEGTLPASLGRTGGGHWLFKLLRTSYVAHP
jgi:RimJ/RimL family protein N-acetyltransferase